MVVEKIGINEIFNFIKANVPQIDLSKIEKEDVAFYASYNTGNDNLSCTKEFVIGKTNIVVTDFTFEVNGKKENIFKPWIVYLAKRADDMDAYLNDFRKYVESQKSKWLCEKLKTNSTYDLAIDLCSIERKAIECCKDSHTM